MLLVDCVYAGRLGEGVGLVGVVRDGHLREVRMGRVDDQLVVGGASGTQAESSGASNSRGTSFVRGPGK